MAEQKRPSPVLVGILAVGIVASIWIYRDQIFGSAAAADAAEAASIKISSKQQALEGVPLPETQPKDDVEAYDNSRNLFDFGIDPRIEVERRAAVKRAEEDRKRAEEAAKKAEESRQKELANYIKEHGGPPPAPTPPPPPPPTPPSFSYSYIGYARRGATDFVAFLDKRGGPGGTTLPVAVGDTIDNQFVVKKIDFDAIQIGYTDPLFKDRTDSVKLIPQAPGRGTK